MKSPDLLAAIIPVVEALDRMGVPYYIGGSIASSAYGTARATMDVDMISDLKPQHVPFLSKMLGSSFYIDEDAIIDAIRTRSCFNLIHLETMIKVDVFIAGDEPYSRETFRRRRKDTLDENEDSIQFYLVSAEDIVLAKLDWYRTGGEVSERQWQDVLGVLKVQENLLDRKYLQCWASELKLSALLERAIADAGIEWDEV
jgi:hypothetical protein